MNAPLNLLKEKNERMKQCPQCDTGYPDSHATCPTHGVLLNEIRDLKPGMLIHKTYRIVRKLGQGGMGSVYLAQHIFMEEPRALKFLSAELSQDEAFTGRFRREVRTLRQLRHNNVVDCGDLEPAEDDSLFFPMEFVDGPDLRAFLNSVKGTGFSEKGTGFSEKGTGFSEKGTGFSEKGTGFSEKGTGFSPYIEANRSDGVLTPEGTLPVEQALHLTRGIAEGLGAAHAKGMVHRDIKPENILMAREGGAWLPKIADFGIVATKESSDVFTRTGGTLLTMTYAAPEQWRGTPAAELDGRTDLYTLGGLLYEMLTGQTPFHAENYEGWARQHQTTQPQSPSALRPDLANWQGLDALVQRLLAKDREDRPKDVAELLIQLDTVRYLPPNARRETQIDEVPSRVSRQAADESPKPAGHRGALFGLLAVGIILALFVVWFTLHRPKHPTNSTAQTSQAVQSQPEVQQPEQVANPMPSNPAPNDRQTPKPTQTEDYKPSVPTPEVPQKPKPEPTEIPKPPVQESETSKIEREAESLYSQGRYSEASPLLYQLCTGGDGRACNRLGDMFYGGQGLPRSETGAVNWYSMACDAGYASGCYHLGKMYQAGKGVTKDVSRAATLYSTACNKGNSQSCWDLALLYRIGDGVGRNDQTAMIYFKKSCSLGLELACDDVKALQ
jgi:serine/threonine protein kinase